MQGQLKHEQLAAVCVGILIYSMCSAAPQGLQASLQTGFLTLAGSCRNYISPSYGDSIMILRSLQSCKRFNVHCGICGRCWRDAEEHRTRKQPCGPGILQQCWALHYDPDQASHDVMTLMKEQNSSGNEGCLKAELRMLKRCSQINEARS